MKKIAIVYIAHDGFTSLYTGVGTVARDFLLSFPSVKQELQDIHPRADLSLYVATMKYKPDAFGFSQDVKSQTIKLTEEHENIQLVELHNGSAGQEAYGTIDNWRNACISAATFLNTLRSDFDEILAICVDTPFVQVANYFLDTYEADKYKFIWMPQSTVRIHGYGMSSIADQQGQRYIEERFLWEKSAIDLAKNNNRLRIGYVGAYMRMHLIEAYGAADDTLVSMTNSLYLPRLEQNKRGQDEIEKTISSLGLPTDRDLLFSFGRAEPYKGLDLILKNCESLIKQHNYYVLIFASPYTMEDPYVAELKDLAKKFPDDIKIVFGLDFITPHYVMQWKHTKILAILSRAEPFGLIPIESRYYNNPALTLLVSDKDGLSYQIDQGKDGYITDLDPVAIQHSFETIANLSAEQKRSISLEGYNKVVHEYDQIRTNVKLLEEYVSDF